MSEQTNSENVTAKSQNDDEKHEECKVTFKKCAPKRRRQIKKKTQSDEEDEGTTAQQSEDTPHIVPAAKRPCIGSSSLIQTSTTTSIEDNKGSKLFSYQSSGAAPEAQPQMYAKSFTEFDETEKNPLNGIIMEAVGKEGVYKGKDGYTNYFPHMDKSMAIKGLDIKSKPVQSTKGIRTITYFDYNPEICKDYYETGYCGFGDDCKFIHDRGDYKSGWEVEREWREREKAKEQMAFGNRNSTMNENEENEEEEEEDFPEECMKCGKKWELSMNPILTKCGHYFCEECTKHFKNNKCPECKMDTKGVFNMAKKLIDKLKKQQK